MAKKKLSELELKIKKTGIAAKAYTDAKAAAEKVYLIEKSTANTGYLKTYILAAGVSSEASVTNDNKIGEINIPKDFLVKSGSVVTATAGTGDNASKWYVSGQEVAAAGKYLDFVINTKDTTNGSETDSHVIIAVTDLVDVYTGGNGVSVNGSNVISLDLTAAGGLQFDGSTDGSKTLGIKIDSTNANGLALTSSGLKLTTATQSAAGAMSAADKVIVDKALTDDDIALITDAEIGSWFGYASDSTMVTTTLPAVSDDSITDEA